MNKDIENRKDIDALMTVFYQRALADNLIGYIFTDVAKLDLAHHLPIIGDFWETMLFHSGDYARHDRNPLQVHGELNDKTRLLPEHFERWLEIFNETVDQNFAGERTEFLKTRAEAIAERMLEYVSNFRISPVSQRGDAAAAR